MYLYKQFVVTLYFYTFINCMWLIPSNDYNCTVVSMLFTSILVLSTIFELFISIVY